MSASTWTRGRRGMASSAAVWCIAVAGFLAAEVAQGQAPGGKAPAASSAATPSATPAASGSAPGASPPPYMYQEPLPASNQPAGPTQVAPAPAEVPPPPVSRRPIPPQYVYEPPPPPPPSHRAPSTSLWLGLRGGILFPGGYLYDDQAPSSPWLLYAQRWTSFASAGPSLEFDVGARFSRRYIVYGFWDRGFLGVGDSNMRAALGVGDQKSASTDLVGVGVRWSSTPDRVGLLIDLGLGYRWFRERWADGTQLDMQGLGEFRLGIGADVRLTRAVSVSPMLMLSQGVFHERDFDRPNAPGTLGDYSEYHSTVSLAIGAHYDIAAGQ